MALAAEIVGTMMVALVISRFASDGKLPLITAAALLLVIVCAVNFWSGAWTVGNGLIHDHSANAALTLEQSNTEAGADFPINEPFMAFADHTIPRHARLYVDCNQPAGGLCGAEQDWFGFRMTPRLLVTSPIQAQWAIFYNVDATKASFAKGWRMISYAPGFALAQRPR